MVLSGAGDALAYNHGTWEFEQNGKVIHAEVKKKGGIAKLDAKHFPVSDDTVMHLATAEALVEAGEGATLPQLYLTLVREYIKSMTDMHGRAAGRLSPLASLTDFPTQSRFSSILTLSYGIEAP